MAVNDYIAEMMLAADQKSGNESAGNIAGGTITGIICVLVLIAIALLCYAQKYKVHEQSQCQQF